MEARSIMCPGRAEREITEGPVWREGTPAELWRTVGVELPRVSLRFQARVESTSSPCDGKASAADLGLQRVAAELNYSAIFRTLASRVLLQPFFLACGRVPPDRNALAPPVDFGSQSIGVYSMLFRQRRRRHQARLLCLKHKESLACPALTDRSVEVRLAPRALCPALVALPPGDKRLRRSPAAI